ncbi:MAG: alpha/beta fold hydrolase [Candidatus Caenarcaniphilales bacterium]|nr:alpha/beta fold hydrolase [Candidatus Caenarcaniphilales bacterium]
MNPSKKNSSFLTTSLNETVYLENNFSSISSQKSQLVAVHGMGAYSGWFNELSDILAETQVGTVTFDLPGFGRSPKRGEVKSHRCWIEATKTAWKEASQKDSNTFLLGHSLGGIIALASIGELTPKPKGVILTVPALSANCKTWNLFNFVIPTFFRGLIDSSEKTTYPISHEVFDSIKKGKHSPDFITAEVRPKLFLETLKVTQKAWSNVFVFKDIPLLMILSEDDPICDPKASRNFFNMCNSTNKTLKNYSGIAHDLFVLPQAEEINGLIADWIATV